MVLVTRATAPYRRQGIKNFRKNICELSAREGVKAYAVLQINKATTNCKQLTDPSKPEALHDFRVAVRRLRTWLRIFKSYHKVKKKTIKKLGDITASTNTSRDLEVCIDMLNKYISSRSDQSEYSSKELQMLLDLLRKDQQQELAGIMNHIPTDWEKLSVKLTNRLKDDIDDEDNIRLPDIACPAILEICKTVEKQLSLIHGIGDRSSIHKLRIYFKRLRYLLEPFRFQLPELEHAINSLKNIQDVLGEFRDAHMSLELIGSYHDTQAAKVSHTGNNNDQSPGIADLLDHARRLELDHFDRFRKLYIHRDFQRIIYEISDITEKLIHV